MVSVLFDTNILIDHFNNVAEAHEEIRRYEDGAISIVTWIEIMAGTPPQHEDAIRAGLGDLSIIPLDEQIADMAFRLRRAHRLKLPDAVIWASAKARGLLLITRDAKDFPRNDPGIRIPYKLN
jgi:predicted nucleic acid-binding protein